MATYSARFVADSAAVDTEEFLASCRAATMTAIDELMVQGVIASRSENEKLMWRNRPTGLILVLTYQVELGDQYQPDRKYQTDLYI